MLINLDELLRKVLFKNGEFKRIDIVIMYLAVEYWYNCKQIDTTYWKMQCHKLWLLEKIDSVSIIHQVNRFIRCMTMFTTGKHIDNKITIGNDHGLIDGAHRLSCYMFYNINNVSVNVVDASGKYEGIDLKQFVTEEEMKRITIQKDNIINALESGKWK